MSSSNNNTTYKKTSFLAGINSEFINEFYADYLSDPSSLPESWKKFFDGLSDDEKLIFDDLKGPSWSPEKKLKRTRITKDKIKENEEKDENINLDVVKQASKDSVRAIMLIRAYRIRGHLIANLDPLSIQKKDEHLELKPETYGFQKKDYDFQSKFQLFHSEKAELQPLCKKCNIQKNFIKIDKYKKQKINQPCIINFD